MLTILAVVLFVALPAAPYEKIFKERPNSDKEDFGEHEDLSGDLVNIGLDDFRPLKGIRHVECPKYQIDCAKFMKCSINCDQLWIHIRDLEKATFIAREEDKVDEKTNPCVAMYAYCIPAPYSRIKKALRLKSPSHF